MTDASSLDLEATIGPLHLAISTLSDEIKKLRKHDKLVVDMPIAGVATCPTPTATFAIDMGHPNAGKWWQVRSLLIGGDDITTAPAGIGWIVVMTASPSANPPLFAVKDFTTGVFPQDAFYGAKELIVEEQEHLWAVITGGTAGVQYSATGMVEVFPQFLRGME